MRMFISKCVSFVLSITLVAVSVCTPFFFVEASETNTPDYLWKNVSLGGGGYITGISICSDGTVYARCDVGGVFKWNNTAKCWDAMTEWITAENSNLFGVDGIAAEVYNSNVVYAALGKYETQSPHGLYKSVDGGKNWIKTSFVGQFGGNMGDRFRGEPIAINPFNNKELMVASRDGSLQRSLDGGETWITINEFEAEDLGKYTRVIAYDNKNEDIVYADIKDCGLYKSIDGGETWNHMGGTNAPSVVNRLRVVDGKVFVAADNGILKYENDVWSVINDYTLNGVTNFRALDVDENNTDRIICCFNNGTIRENFDNLLFYTEDGGKSWSNITESVTKNNSVGWWPEYYFSAHTSDIHFMGEKGVWYSDWYGVWKTSDITAEATIWENEIKGIENMVSFDLSCPTEGAPLIVGVADNCGMRIENADVYPEEKLQNPLRNITTGIDFCEANPMIVARVASDTTGNGAIGISNDNGITYTESVPCKFSGGKIAVSASYNSEGKISIVFIPTNDLPYYSNDMGETWVKSTFPEDTEANFIDKIWRWNMVLQSDRVISDKFYLVNPQNGNFYVSSDGGKTWELTYKRGSGKAAVSIKSAPYMANTVYVSLANEGLKKTVDGGKTFSAIPNVQYSRLIAFGKGINDSTPALYLYGTVNNEDGIFRSVDMGASWVKISNDQTAVGGEPNCMSGDRQSFGTVYIGTNGRGFYIGEERKETVIHTWYDDAPCKNGAHTGDDVTGGYFVWTGGTVDSANTDVVYNGAYSLNVSQSTTYIKYNGFTGKLGNISHAKGSIATGNTYICGWFYTDGDNSHIKLVNTDQQIKKINEWVFMYEKVPANTTSVNAYIAERSGRSNIYVDDLKLVYVNDGSEPTPFERETSIPSQPDMYTKNIYTFYSDGTNYAKHQHADKGLTKYIDWANTEKTVNGAKTIKMTGELYLTPNTTFGALSDEVKTAIEEGRAYLTFWQYINSDNLSSTDEGYDAAVSWDLYFPGNVRTRGEWVWVKTPLTKIEANNIYFKCKNAYAWIGDICISVFEDREAGFLEDKYELKIDDSIIGNEQTSISSQQTLSVSAEYFNNTKKLEKLLPMIAIYDSKGNLESLNQGEVIEIVPFRNGVLEYSYMIPKTSNGDNVKFFLWSALNEMKPIRQAEKFNILD